MVKASKKQHKIPCSVAGVSQFCDQTARVLGDAAGGAGSFVGLDFFVEIY